jgi:hypothetical protein
MGLNHALDLGDRVGTAGPRHEQLRLGRDEPGHHGAQVHGFSGIGRGVHSLNADRFQACADPRDDRGRERVVGRRIGGRQRTLAGGQRENIVSERVARAHDRCGLGQEQVVQMQGEDLGSPAGRFDEGVAEAARDGRRRDGEQAGERPEHQVDVVGGDQVLIVGDYLGRVRRVIDDLQADLASEQATLRVDRIRPQLVALLGRGGQVGEVARRRHRRPDDQWRSRAGRARRGR